MGSNLTCQAATATARAVVLVELPDHTFPVRDEVIRWYYTFATPVFWIIDLVWDAPLRASFISTPSIRYGYYAACVACGVWMWRQPRFTRRIGMSESLTNFTLALLAIWVPMYDALDMIESAPVGFEPTLDPTQPINAGISGASALVSYYAKRK